MSAVIAAPEVIEAAATDVAAIGSALNAAHLTAAAPTVAVLPAAADEVSASIAHLFSQHAHDYQAMAARAAAFQEQFVQHLTAGARSYAAAEAANTASLQPLTATAGSSASAISGLAGQLLSMLTSFWHTLTSQLIGFFIVFNRIVFALIRAYFTLLFQLLTAILALLMALH
jgi:hypothetical protein